MALLDVTPTTPLPEDREQPQVAFLCSGVVLLVWDIPRPVHEAVPSLLADDISVAPTAALRLTRVDGGLRLLWAFRLPETKSFHVALSTGAPGSKTRLSVEIDAATPMVDPVELCRGIDGRGGVTLASTLLGVWSNLFRLQRDETFVAFLRALLGHLAPPPHAASVAARATADMRLLQAPIGSDFGKIDAIYCIGRNSISRLQGRPHRAPLGRNADFVHAIAARSQLATQDALIVFAGPESLEVRTLTYASARLPSVTQWLSEQAKGAPGLREHLLIDLSNRSAAGCAAALEAQLNAPLQIRRVGRTASGLAAEITCALSTPSGTLLAGWIRDPANLVSGVAALSPGSAAHDLTHSLHRFPVTVRGSDGTGSLSGTGFAVLAPSAGGAVPILQPRTRLLLKSGDYHLLVPPPQPADPAEARAVALRAVPPQHVSEALLAQVLAPVIADLHAQARSHDGRPDRRQIGSPIARPKASVVIPLYKVLDFLRFQIAAFATDPWFRRHVELVYVLDSPEQAPEVEHLLTGLHLVYGLPITLVIMDRNRGYARACNEGAAAARGEALALVNSDIIPIEPGWVERLAGRLGTRRRIGAVGPKLLFEDGSLQHAGMYFERDHRGRWLNHHYFKGMPRHYPPAIEERLVPAVTGACLVTSRALFEKVGGFTEDYVIGDYEDSDLCLKIASEDRKILYVPDVELYHLERKSMSLNAEYMRGIAWQYNCALHADRWDRLMSTIMNAHARPGRPRSNAA